ncbi:MAG: hypothetical protein HY908_28055 [Myxococcales bacterium]|nr:hypothetical protein [Myxococcales bacterium]
MKIWMLVGLLASTVALACGSSDETTGPVNTTTGTGATGAGGSGATGGTGGQGATGGQGGQAPAGSQAATEIVNGGQVAESANYRMVFTLGQSSPAQDTHQSAGYRLQGGIIGANGTLP